MAEDTGRLINYIIAAAKADNCLIIMPHMEAFKYKARPFLEGIRHVPARVERSPGRDQFAEIMREPARGHWLFIWVPE